jgi:predicted ribosomally synthesized peptide with nif11-like leader
MAVESAKQFIRRLESQASLQDKVDRAGGTVGAAVQVAATTGYHFTPEEFQAAHNELWGIPRPQNLERASQGDRA